jgi:hypothetical protein
MSPLIRAPQWTTIENYNYFSMLNNNLQQDRGRSTGAGRDREKGLSGDGEV